MFMGRCSVFMRERGVPLRIGVLKEVKAGENRVALTPGGVKTLAGDGHELFVEAGAGARCDAPDAEYQAAGAIIVPDAMAVSENSDLLTKVKEPQPEEFDIFREGQILYSYVHSETRLPLIRTLLDKKITAIALENVRTDDGRFPLLEPMSIIAGQYGVMIGGEYLQCRHGGRGISLVRFPGLPPAKVVVLGAGPAGESAARTAAGLGAQVTLTELSFDKIRELTPVLPANIKLVNASEPSVHDEILEADMVVHTTTIPPDSSYHIIPRTMLPQMKRGSVIVDVTANLRGGVESIDRYTTHADPVWEVDGVIHYAVTNIPSAVAATASRAYEAAHLGWLRQVAAKGAKTALAENPPLLRGLTAAEGILSWHEAGTMQQLDWMEPHKALEQMV
ncbi:Alanine dehydrogenase [Pseudodesulfovibrio profundus]|uniref:alanine dehydrogenase n=2 Tax=Pseudodesulfovibrio profundus TaxID=57320 RepID=A0A2C8FCM1_9BACT|nr:Alanine dehydrogenase [Pseudodesulfovibrio profundus]